MSNKHCFYYFVFDKKIIYAMFFRCRSSWPDPSQRNKANSKCLQDMMNKDTSANDEDNDAILKEEMEEKDDPEHLEQARAMDEYKDIHRRGWGNRANRS